MGHAPDFGGVRDAFERNFALRNEVGAAVVAWVDGDLVVNLWGGWADAARTRPWQQNTLTTVLSGTKGLTSTCGARYWPEFGQAGKEAITLAMVLSHRSGVIGPRTPMTWQQVTDWDFVCEQLVAAEPWWARHRAPDDEISSYDLQLWRELEFPGTNGQVSALGLATFYNAPAQEKLASTWTWSGNARAARRLIWCSGGGSPTTAGVWATC